MQKRSLRVITFDLDDTLWDAGPVLASAEQHVFAWLERHAPKVTQHFTTEQLAHWRNQVYANNPQLSQQISQLRLVAMQEVLSLVGYDQYQSQQLAEDAFEVFIAARHDVTLFDEVIPMLSALKRHYILGTLTNGNADICKLPIANFFQFSYRAEQFNAGKPSPEMFLAAQQTGGCTAKQLIHIGDHFEHDVTGARRAGSHALWFNPTSKPHPEDQQPTMQVQSLSDITQAIDNVEKMLDCST